MNLRSPQDWPVVDCGRGFFDAPPVSQAELDAATIEDIAEYLGIPMTEQGIAILRKVVPMKFTDTNRDQVEPKEKT